MAPLVSRYARLVMAGIATSDTARALYVLPLDGGEARRVLGHDTGITSCTWSPDGARVAFIAPGPPSKARRDLEEPV